METIICNACNGWTESPSKYNQLKPDIIKIDRMVPYADADANVVAIFII